MANFGEHTYFISTTYSQLSIIRSLLTQSLLKVYCYHFSPIPLIPSTKLPISIPIPILIYIQFSHLIKPIPQTHLPLKTTKCCINGTKRCYFKADTYFCQYQQFLIYHWYLHLTNTSINSSLIPCIYNTIFYKQTFCEFTRRCWHFFSLRYVSFTLGWILDVCDNKILTLTLYYCREIL